MVYILLDIVLGQQAPQSGEIIWGVWIGLTTRHGPLQKEFSGLNRLLLKLMNNDLQRRK